jgi:hypothetical protein
MCLYTQQKTAEIAQKNITVYKTVYITEQPELIISSVLKFFRYEIGLSYKEPRWDDRSKPFMPSLHKMVNYGFHSYVKYWDAFRICGTNKAVLKCVIPKGTKYFLGEDGTGDRNYCSEELRVVAYKLNGLGDWYVKPGVKYTRKSKKKTGKKPE